MVNSIVWRVMNHVDSKLVYTYRGRLRIIRPAKEIATTQDTNLAEPCGEAGNDFGWSASPGAGDCFR